MSKQLLGLVALIAAVVSVVFTAGTAAADAGHGATVTHFSVTYPGDLATCAGNRIEQSNGHPFIKDVETCLTVIDFYAPGTYSVTDPLVEWCSDFDGFAECNPATSGTLTVSANGDGTFTWSIVAYYAKH